MINNKLYLARLLFAAFFGVFLLLQSPVFAQKSVNSAGGPPNIFEIFLNHPIENALVSSNQLLFKGKVPGGQLLEINDDVVSLNRSGHFSHIVYLRKPDQYYDFDVTARSKTGQIRSVHRRVYFKTTGVFPIISVETPSNNQIVTRNEMVVKGHVSDAKSFYLNRNLVPVQKSGQFEYTLKIPSSNARLPLVFEAISSDGQKSMFQTSVIHRAEVGEPELRILSPVKRHVSKSSTAVIKGLSRFVSSITVNDQAFKLDDNGRFAVNVSLTKPNEFEKFVIKGKSSLGEEVIAERSIFFDAGDNFEVANTQNVAEGELIFTGANPSLIVTNPNRDLVTKDDEVMVSGVVLNASRVLINDQIYETDEDGQFREWFRVDELGAHDFSIIALGDSSQSEVKLRRVFRVNRLDSTRSTADVIQQLLMRDGLDQRISLNLAGSSIKDILHILSERSGLNIIADKSLKGTLTLQLSDVTIRDALHYVLDSQGLMYKISDNTILVGQSGFVSKPTNISGHVIPFNFLDVKNAKTALQGYLADGESIEVVEKSNVLVAYAGKHKIKQLEALAYELDSAQIPQMLLEVFIVEVSTTALKNLGVSWPSNLGLKYTATFGDGATSFSDLEFSTIWNAMESDGRAKVLARPRMKIVHKKKGTIFIGDKVPYVEFKTDATGRVSEKVSFVDAGITIEAEADVNLDRQEVMLSLKPEVSFINGFVGPRNDIPVVRTRRADTSVRARSGEMVLIGGLLNSSDSDSLAKVPLISNLPLIGNLFESNKVEQTQTELIIAVVPRIVGLESDVPSNNRLLAE